MTTVETTIRIGAPPEVVGRVLLDADRAPQWTAGLDRLEVTAGRPGEVGCVGRAHYVEGRRRYTLEDVLEQVTPDRFYRSRLTGGGIRATVETTLEPVGQGETQLSLRWEGRGTAQPARILLPLLKRRIARRAHRDLCSLRRLAEAETR